MRTSPRLAFKRAFYRLSKRAGLFAVARYLTRRELRILCYHGFSLGDEHVHNPQTFMRCDTFRRRMAYLKAQRFAVLGLDEALRLLEQRRLREASVVITIDDGFYSTYRCAYPILVEHSFPGVVYATTYYSIEERPVFRLVVPYLLWKTSAERVDLSGLGLARPGFVSIGTKRERDALAEELIRHGEGRLDEEGREGLSRMLGERLSVDYGGIAGSRILGIVTMDEMREMCEHGIDIQLHTHRHRLPLDREGALREIRDNRAALEPLGSRNLRHLCYPSGIWSMDHWPWLEEAGIASAATCERGLNGARTPRFALKRFGDDEDLSQIEFEAEMSGYAELFQRMRGAAARMRAAFAFRRKASRADENLESCV